MKTFRTVVSTTPSPNPISHADRILLLGSCFADAIGERLERFKFAATVNPFGVIYNPISIHRLLHYAISNQVPPEHSYLTHNEVHLNFDLHSKVSTLDRTALQERIRQMTENAHQVIRNASRVFITYGTAWVYRRRDTGEIVANCHKQPQALFERSLLSATDIVSSFEETNSLLKKLNPNVGTILTVSPVRHVRDTLELNSVSKAVLRLACHNIAEKIAGAEYFPAFEMMVDDLRDYRFYGPDMLHPTNEAEDYIWDAFAGRYFAAETRAVIKDWNGILSALQHKPFHPESATHQQFLRRTLARLEAFRGKLNVDKEVAAIRKQLL